MNQLIFSPKSITIAGAVAVTNAIKTSTATATSPQTYTVAYSSALPRTVSVTSSALTGAYVAGSAIIFTGTDANNNPQTETLLLTQVNGSETVVGVLGFSTVTSITVAAQATTTGAFVWGVQDIAIPSQCRGVRVGTAGALKVKYGDGSSDTIPAAVAAESLPIGPIFVYGTSATTASNLTFYF